MNRQELYDYMEQKYKRNGASANAAQLTMRLDKFNKMLDVFGLQETEKLLFGRPLYEYHMVAARVEELQEKKKRGK